MTLDGLRGHGGQPVMRVDDRVAVPRPVLHARGDAARLQGHDRRGDALRDDLRVGAERARSDHRVQRIIVHVAVGREHQVDPGGAQPRGQERPGLGGGVDREQPDLCR